MSNLPPVTRKVSEDSQLISDSSPANQISVPPTEISSTTNREGVSDRVISRAKKSDVDKQLADLEQQIYDMEGRCVQSFCNLESIILDPDNFFKKAKNLQTKASDAIDDKDRIFSKSSLSSPYYSKKNKRKR